jgi:GT2 family glycosyltransferase
VHDPLVISIVTPVYDPDADVLEECLASVMAQSYPHWELLLVDDCSPRSHVWRILQALAATDDRVRVRRRSANGGIVAASNDALDLANGDVVVLLDHDDQLDPNALATVAETFRADDSVDYAYSDEDVISADGRRVSPFFKPDWSPERLRSQMYTCHLSAIRASVIDQVGGFREGYDGSQDWDLILRVTEAARTIVHIPKVLYHWRTVPTSVLAGADVKPYAYEAARRAVEAHCARIGLDAEVIDLEPRGNFRVKRRLADTPLVSVIIPTRGSSGVVWGARRAFVTEAVRSIVEMSTYPEIEIVLVVDHDTPADVIDDVMSIGGSRVSLVPFDGPFNFSEKCNDGAFSASGTQLIFLNDDVEVIDADWIETMVGLSNDADVGAVGCELLFEDGRIQHAGHVYIDGNPGHLMFGQSPDADANRMALSLDREVSGVTAAALMCRAEVFDEVGGFSTLFANNYNDVDLCCKIRASGYRIVVTPHAKLHHFESATRDPAVSDAELMLLRDRWGTDLWNDEFYNPNFTPGMDNWPQPLRYP